VEARWVCASCHVLFGEGKAIGPDLTGAQRSSLDYLLESIVAPAATLRDGFRISTIALKDGRIIDGIVGAQNGQTLAIQTPTENLVVHTRRHRGNAPVEPLAHVRWPARRPGRPRRARRDRV
jgi:putative heme-binding domain-containing protein